MKSQNNKLQDSLNKNCSDIKLIKERLREKQPRPSIKYRQNELLVRKALIEPNFSSKTVLTDSTWRYVEIFLKERKNYQALNYWNQAHNFFEATENLSMISKPLTTYYCFLNAAKSLLTFKNINFNLKHGVSGKTENGHILLKNELVTIFPSGVLSGLSNYMKETIATSGETYTLKDILYNLEYIHRAYCLTYNSSDLFIPIENLRFVFDKDLKKGWLEAQLEPQHSNKSTLKKISGFGVDNYYPKTGVYTIRRNKKFLWDTHRNIPTTSSLNDFKRYYFNIRRPLRYIFSPNKLWYIKRSDLKSVINKSSLTLTYAAMHRLSELSRYDPNKLDVHLNKSDSWLLSEFITKSIYQFIDIISSEITGDDFRVTGFRT